MSANTDAELRNKYDRGEITAEDFIGRLFASESADRHRREIVEDNRKQNERER